MKLSEVQKHCNAAREKWEAICAREHTLEERRDAWKEFMKYVSMVLTAPTK